MSDSNNNPQYPRWVHEIIDSKMHCPKCNREVLVRDIISIGVIVPDDNQIYDRRPRAQLIASCPDCFQQTGYQMQVDKLPLLCAVKALFDEIESKRPFTESALPFLPSPNLKPPPKPGDPPFEVRPGQSIAAKEFEKRRQRMKDKLAQLPTDEEVQAFLNQLGSVNRKRTSKAYQSFMRKLGIDIAWPGDAHTEENP